MIFGKKDLQHGGGFYLEVDPDIRDIENRLGHLKAKAPNVLAKAINDTAKWASKELAAEAQKRYQVQKVKFAKEFSIKRATPGSQEAILRAKGSVMSTSKFKVTPSRPKPNPEGSPPARLAILKGKSPKEVTSGSGLQAIIVKFQSGHVAVAQREPPRKYKSSGWGDRKRRWADYLKKTGRLDQTRIQEFYGPSVPAMLKKVGVTQEFIDANRPKILEHLEQAITKYINTELYFASKGRR